MTDIGLLTRRATSVAWWARFAPSANARSVAALRIATGVAAMYTAVDWVRYDPTGLPSSLWRAPRGMTWVVPMLPTTSVPFLVGCIVFMALCVAIVVGYRSRPAAAVAALLGIYLGVMPHLTGKVDHYHHVIWFLALVALAPSDDAWSIRRSEKQGSQASYAAVTLAGTLMLGVIYLSAGIPKLGAGPQWVFSDNMRNLIWGQWREKSHTFLLPVDTWPLVFRSMALGSVLFEMLFLPMALFRRTRPWIAGIGITFHVMTWAILGIGFWSLVILYAVLVDWAAGEGSVSTSQPIGLGVAAPLMLAVVIALGIAGEMVSDKTSTPWPVAAYPSFAHLIGPEIAAVYLWSEERMTLLNESGLAETYGPHRVAAIASTALSRDLIPELLDHVASLEGHPPGTYDALDVVVVSTNPELRASSS